MSYSWSKTSTNFVIIIAVFFIQLHSFSNISEIVSYFDVDENFDSVFFADTSSTNNQSEQQTQRANPVFKRSTFDSSVDKENDNSNLISRRKRDTAASFSSSSAAVESLNALRRLRGQLGSKAFVELLGSSFNNLFLEHEVCAGQMLKIIILIHREQWYQW